VVSALPSERVLEKTLTLTVQPTPDPPLPVAPVLVLLPVPELQASSPAAKTIKIHARVITVAGRRVPWRRSGFPLVKSRFKTVFFISGTIPIPSLHEI
jgi:hypothetical protein